MAETTMRVELAMVGAAAFEATAGSGGKLVVAVEKYCSAGATLASDVEITWEAKIRAPAP